MMYDTLCRLNKIWSGRGAKQSNGDNKLNSETSASDGSFGRLGFNLEQSNLRTNLIENSH